MDRSVETKKVGILGMVVNIFLLIIKFIIGFAFNSQGLMADAVNSLGDVFSSLVTYVGGKISSKPEDEDHEFGHGKAEFVASLLIGIFMVIVSLDMLYSSAVSIIQNKEFTFSVYLILVPFITMIVKFIMYLYVRRVSKQNDSLLIMSNAKDHRNDILLSLGVIIGIVFGYYGFYFVDGIVGIILSVIIIITGLKITYEAYDVLIDRCIDVEIVNEMKEDIEAIAGVEHVDSIKSKPTGNLHMMIVKLSVDADMTVRDSHKIAGIVREMLIKKEDVYDAIVHVNPEEK